MSLRAADRADTLSRFVVRFDRSQYWLAHEELEALWLVERVDAYKGLIHLAAAMLHLQRGNRRGAITKLASGLVHLRARPQQLANFDLASVRRRFGSLLRLLSDRPSQRVDPGAYRLGPAYHGPWATDLEDVELPYRVQRHQEGYRPGRDPKRRD